MGKDSDWKWHELHWALSQSILQKAWEEATKKHHYNSVKTCTDLHKLFSEWASRFDPHEWQLDVVEALLLAIDSVVIVGTGSGKTIPFMLPLLLHCDKMVLIVSPLKVLQHNLVHYPFTFYWKV